MSSNLVHIHPGGTGARGRRGLVVRATTSPEEQAFFLKLQKEMKAPTMADLIRHCCVKIAIQEGVKIELPQTWRALYDLEG